MRGAVVGVLAALVSLSGVPAAKAADMTPAPLVKAPSYIPAQFMWTGFYVGASVGWGFGSSSFNDPFPATVAAGSPRLSGLLLGGVTGINYQIGSVVIGAEGDFTGSWAKGSVTDAARNFLNTEVMWTSTVAARFGWAFDRLLIYGKGGGAFDQDRNTAALPNGSNDIGSTYRAGWDLGAGAEYAVTEHMIVRIAYDYMKFPSKNITFQGSALVNGQIVSPLNSSVGVTLNEIKGVLEYKF
jgi:outer membrane immunogenic protein